MNESKKLFKQAQDLVNKATTLKEESDYMFKKADVLRHEARALAKEEETYFICLIFHEDY